MRYSRVDQVKGVVGLKIFRGFWIIHVPKPEPRVNTGLTGRRYFFGLLGAVGVWLYIVSQVWPWALVDNAKFKPEYVKRVVSRSFVGRPIRELFLGYTPYPS